MLRSRLINILIPILFSVCAFAQEADSVRTDSVKINYRPSGIRIGTDLISLFKSQFQNNFTGWEVNADMDFHRYHLALDYGSWGRTYSSDSAGNYSNDGTYWRAGIDVNFLLKDPDRNMFFIGFRYGKANFSEILNVYAFNPFDSIYVSNDYSHSGIHARWFELTTGIRVKIYKIIWMGYTARFKFGLKHDSNTENIIPSDVPGYGGTEKDSNWGFNYQIFVRIPLRKLPQFIEPKN